MSVDLGRVKLSFLQKLSTPKKCRTKTISEFHLEELLKMFKFVFYVHVNEVASDS